MNRQKHNTPPHLRRWLIILLVLLTIANYVVIFFRPLQTDPFWKWWCFLFVSINIGWTFTLILYYRIGPKSDK